MRDRLLGKRQSLCNRAAHPIDWDHLKITRLTSMLDCWLGKKILNIDCCDAPVWAAPPNAFKGNSSFSRQSPGKRGRGKTSRCGCCREYSSLFRIWTRCRCNGLHRG